MGLAPAAHAGTVPAGALQASTAVVWGRFEVGLTAIDDDGDRRKIARYLRKALPLLHDLAGPPPRRLRVEVVGDRSLGPPYRFIPEHCGPEEEAGALWMQKPDETAVYARALAAAYRVCDRSANPIFGDDIAEAVNQIVLQRARMRSPWRMERVQYIVANRPGIGGGADYRADSFPALVSMRFQLSATAFRIFEEDHPGFFARLNAALARKLSTGPVDKGQEASAFVEADPSFLSWFQRQHLFEERPRGDQLLLVAQGDWVRLLAVERDEFGRETPRTNLPLSVNVSPPHRQFEVTTGGGGEATFELAEATTVRPGREVTLRAQGGDRSDELTFTPVPPDTDHAGAPHPWDLVIWTFGGGSLVLAWWSDRRTKKATNGGVAATVPSRVRPFLRSGTVIGLAVVCCSVGVGSVRRAVSRFDDARWVLATGGQPATAVRDAPPGRRVVMTGLIDPRLLPVDRARGFALYLGEYYSTESTWEWDYTMAPPFTVVLDDGSVEVRNGCRDANGGWTIARVGYNDDCYRLLDVPVTEYNGDGNDRYRGFKPGDPVVVFGTLQGGGIVASAVSGGTLQNYAADLRGRAWERLVVGSVLLVIGSALWLTLALTARSRWRARRG